MTSDTQMLFWIGIIAYKDGTVNTYLGATLEEVYAQIYEYVAEFWDDIASRYGPMPEDQQEAIRSYFEHIHGEDLTIEEAVLPESVRQIVLSSGQ